MHPTEFGDIFRVSKLKAYDLVHREGVVTEQDFACQSTNAEVASEQLTIGYIAFWVAYFEVERVLAC